MANAQQEDQALKEALMKKALGYDYEEKVIEARKDGTQRVKIIKKHVPPDPKAAETICRLKMCGYW